MRLKTILSRFAILLVFAGIGMHAAATKEQYINTAHAGAISSSTPLHLEDARFTNTTSKALIKVDHLRRMVISVFLDENAAAQMPASFTTNVGVDFTGVNYSSSTTPPTGNYHIDFQLAYDRAGTYKLRDYRVFNGYGSGTTSDDKLFQSVDIIGVVVSNSSVSQFVKVSVEIIAEREYLWNCATAGITSLTNTAFLELDQDINTIDEYEVEWDLVLGADEYDIEWAWVDVSANIQYVLNPSLKSKIFTNNATRVSVLNRKYRIPLLYDGEGYIYYRVRPVKVQQDGQRLEGKWSDAGGTPGLKSLYFTGFQRKLNWQSTTSFAEEGKRKSVVNYYDGSLRSRQTSTKDNSRSSEVSGTARNNTVVAETFYDYQGRASIQVLPAPTLNTVLSYAQNFNRNINNAEYEKKDYDNVNLNGAACGVPAVGMASTTSGAAHYYSPQSSILGSGTLLNPLRNYENFVPDAEHFPFTQTEYSQDNTGRVVRQGGVGPTHQLGQHDTRYFYTKPSQEELDALFGTNAGYFGHYFKNWVRDANGQYSISYTDMHGRTVATALAGQNAEGINMQKLESNVVIPNIEENILDNNTKQPGETAITSTYSFVVPATGYYQIKYTFGADEFNLAGCNNSNICYDCLYDLNLRVTDECGGVVYNGDFRNFSLNGQNVPDINTTCGTVPTPFNIEIRFAEIPLGTTVPAGIYYATPLGQGNYTVHKVLTVSRQALERYRDNNFFQTNITDCKTFIDFYNEEKALLDLAQPCELTCSQCRTLIGSEAAFTSQYYADAGITTPNAQQVVEAQKAYISAVKRCNEVCSEGEGLNTALRDQLLSDLTPDRGQYAYYEELQVPGGTPVFDPRIASDKSIFYVYQTTPLKRNYQRPVFLYKDAAGNPDIVMINGVGYSPNDLGMQDFIDNFKPSWAETLLTQQLSPGSHVYLHQEYNRLRKADEWTSAYNYDDRMQHTDTYAEAASSGFINPLSQSSTGFPAVAAATEPLKVTITQTSEVTGVTASIESKLANVNGSGFTAWQWAVITTMCPQTTPSGSDPCTTTYAATAVSSLCQGDRDMAWRAFRQLYIQAKAEAMYTVYSGLVTFDVGPQVTDPVSGTQVNAYNPHFIDPSSVAGAPGSPNPAGGSITDVVDANCRAYVDEWRQRLEGCTYTPAQWAELEPKLIAICKAGGDINHPTGSSSFPLPYTGTVPQPPYSSFIDQIAAFNLVKNIAVSPSCNGYLLIHPKPYNASINGQVDKITYSVNPMSCECTNVNGYYQAYQSGGGVLLGSFGDYLRSRLGISMSDAEITRLRNLCNATPPTPACINESTPLIIPPALHVCESSTQFAGCINCTKMETLFTLFTNEFPGQVPVAENTEPLQQPVNNLFAAFMNYHTGFDYSHNKYLDFRRACLDSRNGLGETSLEEDCQNLLQLRKDFKCWFASLADQYVNLPALHPCAEKPLLFGLEYPSALIPLDAADYIYDGKFNYPVEYDETHQAGGPSALFQRDLCVDNKFAAEARILNSRVKPDASLGTSETWLYKGWVKDVPANYVFLSFGILNNATPQLWVRHNAYEPGSPAPDNDVYYTIPNTINLNDWYTLRYEVDATSIKIMIEGVVIANIARRGTFVLSKVNGFSFWLEHGYNKKMDWLKLYTNDFNTPVYEEHFNSGANMARPLPSSMCPVPACEDAFVSYFNKHYGGSRTYAQIQSLYVAKCGAFSDPCATLPPADASLRLCGTSTRLTPGLDYTEWKPCDDNKEQAEQIASIKYARYVQEKKDEFERTYLAHCLDVVGKETMTLNRPMNEYHYTLYYYDQAGNLVQTIPPSGVNPVTDLTKLAAIKASRIAGNASADDPKHNLATQYQYTNLNQVGEQKTPDAGTSKFWYDRLGRLVLSQNAHQATNDGNGNRRFSYTLYDRLGRISEVGQVVNSNTVPASGYVFRTKTEWRTFLNSYASSGLYREQITRTVYDLARTWSGTQPHANWFSQQNLRNRVSYSEVIDLDATALPAELEDGTTSGPVRAGTHYTYDIHGNVDRLLQHYNMGLMDARSGANKNQFKVIKYDYDLISGKVNEVQYQPSYRDGDNIVTFADQFFHQYEYDAENRLTHVKNSLDGVYWELDAQYEYYRHGPLARTLLGHQKVQGLDYAYTLQGWLKGVNGNNAAIAGGAADMGGDAATGNTVARDIYSFSLHYHGADYKAIGAGAKPFADVDATVLTPAGVIPNYRPLYNGNITSMAVHIPGLGGNLKNHRLYNYQYDQLNRIVAQDTWIGFNGQTSNSWAGATMGKQFKERVEYDPNGNIKKYLRDGDHYSGSADATPMDNLTYHYLNLAQNNKLGYVQDAVAARNYSVDIDDQTSGNYLYDAIGNLIHDQAEDLDRVDWTVYGKIFMIKKNIGQSDANSERIFYSYDAAGNRISKQLLKPGESGMAGSHTWYVRDAQGNVMSTYELTSPSAKLTQTELHIYGSSRLGILKRNENVEDIQINTPEILDAPGGALYGTKRTFDRGFKLFELSNHLGNVLTTITDKKPGVSTGGSTVDYYAADVATATDYYPFGMPLPNPGADRPCGALTVGDGSGVNSSTRLFTSVADNFTVEFWANPTSAHLSSATESTTSYPGLSDQKFAIEPPYGGSSTAGMGVSVGTDGVRVFEHAAGYLPPLLVWNSTVSGWTHIAVSYINKQPHLYINGQLVHTGLMSPMDHVYPGNLIGSGTFSLGESAMDGELDEVRIWNTVRTAEEIRDNMNHSLPVPQSTLIAYWPIQPGDGTQLEDISGNDFHVLLNSTYSTSSVNCSNSPVGNKKKLYRYGFNGQEMSNEIKGVGNSYTAEFWEYDPRLGRRWNVDPVRKEGLSGYSVNALNPIWYMDPLGDDWFSNDQGMFIWAVDPSIMMHGFRNYHGTQLPEDVPNSQILTTVPGKPGFYYKYKSDGLGKFANWVNGLFGYPQTNVTLKKYSWHDVAIGAELRDYALMGVLAKIASPIAKAAMRMLKSSGGSLWKMASWVERGFVYEASQGANLVKNYPVIDKFMNGVATSIKTLDFNMVSYAKNAKSIYNTLKGYIDKLAEFKGANFGGVNTVDQIEKKILNVGVPKGANEEQIKMLQQAVEYGKSLNIEVQIKAVK